MAAHSSKRPTRRPFKQVTDVARERESIGYFSAFHVFTRVQNAQQAGEKRLPAFRDPTLTALAQLGTHLTGTERSFCSLFDAEYQYMLADATPYSHLRPFEDDDDDADADAKPRLLSGACIHRQHMPCQVVLSGAGCDLDQVNRPDAQAVELPVTISKDLQNDSRFSVSTLHHFGIYARSYAAVPIRTKRGINIGVYCVMSSTPGKEWTQSEGRRLRDISRTIMSNLENARNEKLYRVNERMKRGLGSFVEGRTTLSGWQYGSNASAFSDVPGGEGGLNDRQQKIERKRENDALDIIDGNKPNHHEFDSLANTDTQPTPGRVTEDKTRYTEDWVPTSTDTVLDVVFSKAANIIRESAEVEGCVFVDASMDAYQTSNSQAGNTDGHVDPRLSTSSSDESKSSDSGQDSSSRCRLLGFSTSDSSSVDGDGLQTSQIDLGHRRLRKLLKMYPRGKIFNFDAEGGLQTSDSSEEDVIAVTLSAVAQCLVPDDKPATPSSASSQPTQPQCPRSRNDGKELARAFPGVRSIAFVPVWNSSQGCWFAGAFVYTKTPTRTFTVQGELSYLRAFGTVAAAEIVRLNALQSEKAKTDALGSLSHELRSPLHGILLSAELMADTDLNVFQANTAHTIETCTHTLLDTIDHLLEYSKVNNLAGRARQSRPSKRLRASESRSSSSNTLGQKNLIQPCQVDNLVEEVVESVFAGFNFQHLAKEMNTEAPRVNPDYHDAQSSLQESGQVTNPAQQDRSQGAEQVSVGLSIETNLSWLYQVPVGAVRRIVMNIFGNALKYTQRGTVKVSLSQETVSLKGRKRPVVKLVVQDTGKGISNTYLHTGLYEPFSQEDNLAAGTGLGLSMVKQIVAQLRGRISIRSQVGVGTAVTVVLPLDRVPDVPGVISRPLEVKQDFENRVRDLMGMRVQLVLPRGEHVGLRADVWKSAEIVCRDWLHLDVIPQELESEVRPDLVLWMQHHVIPSSEKFKTLSLQPNVVICQSPLEAYKQTLAFEAAGHSGIFEFVSQPAGPRKLARALLLAYQRWVRSPDPRPVGKTPKRRPSYIGRSNSSVASDMTETNPSSQASFSVSEVTHYSAPQSMHSVANSVGSKSHAKVNSSGTGLKLLLVDDNHINLKILSTCVGKLEFGFELANNGKEAYDSYCKNPNLYAAVLMDISMPVMNGFEAARAIRTFEDNNSLKPVCIIALSGLASDNAQREAVGSGVSMFLTKPVKMKQLHDALSSKGVFSKG